MTIQELEQIYKEEMEKVGLACKPKSEEVLEERKIINDERVMKRGKLAEEKHLNRLRDVRGKGNATIRTKKMTRETEDIRGISDKWRRVIQQAARQVVLDVPVTNVDDFKPRKLQSKQTTATHNPSASPKRAGSKTPITTKILPCRSPDPQGRIFGVFKRSSLVPRFMGNFEDSSSWGRSSRLTSAELPSQEPLVQSYSHQAWYSRSFRLGSRLVERADPLQTDTYGSPKTRTLHRRPIPVSCVPTSAQSSTSDDEDLNAVLRRYLPSSLLSQGQENYPPSVSPAEFSRRRFERTEFTPPSRENYVIVRKSSSRNTNEPISQRNRKNSRKKTEISSDSESDVKALVKLVVNINCGQRSQEQERERVKIVKSVAKSCQVTEEKIKTRNTGTQSGESLTEGSQDESDSEDQVVKKRMGRKKNLCVCKKYGCCSHCVRELLQRTSTSADLPRGQQPPIQAGDEFRRYLLTKEKAQPISARPSLAKNHELAQTGKKEGAIFLPIKAVDSQNNSKIKLKQVLEDLDQLLSSSSDSSSPRGCAAIEENGGKWVEKKRQTKAVRFAYPAVSDIY